MMSISVSARALVAARAVDPEVSTAAVRAAVEVALAEQRRELEIRQAAMSADGRPATPGPDPLPQVLPAPGELRVSARRVAQFGTASCALMCVVS